MKASPIGFYKKVYVSLADFRVTKWVLFLVEIFEDL
jgi:hypothetical protein